MFFAFFNLFGSIVLLPIYLQTLMGYTASLAGLVLGPGGISTMFAMPIAGRLVTKVNPKGLLAFGIVIVLPMQRISCHNSISRPISIPLSGQDLSWHWDGISLYTSYNSDHFATIRKEDMGNASAIFNLLRNLGGSFGVAFVTTILSRRAQFHQSILLNI